ncbi:MAG: diaminopimelate decarboxylase [Lachnospiraceae bacterium]|nr:diaminopimelate decarboxylase [Ruminococcus sp.]MCM1274398.1 diaminopimelate decarboxylase [Lachnospiraceae bacterium]
MKKPFVTKEQIEEIVKTYPTPFHIYDEKGIRENARALKAAFSWNKGFREYFAVKATPNPFIMKILQEEGCGFDCSSYTELLLSDEVGAKEHDIMFSSNATPDEDFKKAFELGAIINLDDFTHIEVLDKLTGIPETVCCRYNPGGEFKTDGSPNVMDTPRDAKYGMTPEQITEAYKILKTKGAKRFGMHAFLASNTLTNDYYPTLARIMFREAVKIKEKAGVELSFINLSGGVGIPYKPEQPANDIAVIGEKVREAYEEILVPAGMGNVALFTELGRFMLAPYGMLIAKAIREKHIYKEYIGLDACAANLMRPAIYGAYHHITVLGKEDAPCDYKYDVTGGLCENCDKFAIDRMLPKIDIGDYIAIHDTGAHGFSMGYNYNGKLLSAELLLRGDGSVKLIRRAETPEDYFATFDFAEGKFEL